MKTKRPKGNILIFARYVTPVAKPEPVVDITVPLHVAIALGWILGETTGAGLGSFYHDLLQVADAKLGISDTWRHAEHGLPEEKMYTKNRDLDTTALVEAAQKLVEKQGFIASDVELD